MTFRVILFIYKSAAKYFEALINSLNNQLDLNFEVIIFNDDFNNAISVFSKLKMDFQVVNLISKTPLDLRLEGLERLKSFKNSFFIFQDCDDLLDISRVKVVKQFASYYNLVSNDLTLITENENTVSSKIWRDRIDKFEFTSNNLLEYNFVGFGNTSFHCDLLDYIPDKPTNNLLAADWYVFFNLLRESKITGYFTSNTVTFYRQHEENIIGVPNQSSIKKSIEIRNTFFFAIGLENYKKLSLQYKLPEYSSHNYPFWWELIPNSQVIKI